jgi:hypothetical protein
MHFSGTLLVVLQALRKNQVVKIIRCVSVSDGNWLSTP